MDGWVNGIGAWWAISFSLFGNVKFSDLVTREADQSRGKKKTRMMHKQEDYTTTKEVGVGGGGENG
jgi:hypothetical protein